MKKFDYSNNREFMLEVLLHATDPDIKKTNKKLYNDLISLLHEKNQGVGAAIATGYKWSRDRGTI